MNKRETNCEIMVGHAIDQLRKIPDGTVDLVCTSPPYWGLRDYKTEPVVFGGIVECEHQWDNDDVIHHQTCTVCGAWRGQLGLEASPELFVEHLVEIFEECRRVLKPSGNLWVNLGDSYMRKSQFTPPDKYGLQKHRDEASQFRPSEIPEGYKRKDLVGLPWLFAFAARRAGWYLRNDVVWAKSISGVLLPLRQEGEVLL
jgi:DNA modification methylase